MYKFLKIFQKLFNIFQNEKNKNIFEIKNKKFLINSHSNLNYTAGDTIMISNYMNLLMKNDNFIFLLSKHEVNQNFIRNLDSNNYEILKCDDNKQLIKQIDYLSNKVDYIFLRNHLIIDQINIISKMFSPFVISIRIINDIYLFNFYS